MKILFTGGGSGGHFYPIIAIAKAVKTIAREDRLLEPSLYFAAPHPFDKQELFNTNVTYMNIAAGKRRLYFSPKNFFDIFKTGWGIVKAIIRILILFPDVIFGKGGYGSFPALVAGRILGIPVIIHESDSVPGRVNRWAGRFAKKVALSFPEAAQYFDKEKVALTGMPIRRQVTNPENKGGAEFFNLNPTIPTIFIISGSQGAQMINETVLSALPELLQNYQIIHQTGQKNFDLVTKEVRLVMQDVPKQYQNRYRIYPYLDLLSLRMAAGAATLVVSRAGSTIFEIAAWKKPSIIIPITESHGDHQRRNAFSYARADACVVIEENNLTPHILVSEIGRIIENKELLKTMQSAASAFATPDAAQKIAREIIDLALEHEA